MKVNFFIAGFPKSGTTSLYHGLKQHPQIFMPPVKEPEFFCFDFHRESDQFHKKALYFPYRKRTDYLSLFKNIRQEEIAGEASSLYIFSPQAPQEIYRHNPEAKIIIIIRNPADFLLSFHNHCRFKNIQPIKDLEKALKSSHQNKQIATRYTKFPTLLNYWRLLNYRKHLNNYLNIFPQRQILLLSFEDFKKSPEKVFKKVFNFLEVDDDFNPDLRLKNPGKEQIAKPIHLALQNPFLKKIFQNILPISARDSIFEFLMNIFSQKIPTETKSSEKALQILNQSTQGKRILRKYKEIKKLFN
ncbi:MAG: sulfotransferase domain-containing protein [Patescibacteria group bacterium]